MFDILDRISNLIGDTAAIVIIICLLILAVVSEIWEWIVWLKLKPERPLSAVRRAVQMTSLAGGMVSMMLFALSLTGMVRWVTGGKDWAVNLWIFSGAGVCWLALAASAFCRGRVRIAGIIAGVLMSWFWWSLWGAVEFGRAWAEVAW